MMDDVDFDFCASAFKFSGGEIRNVALSAAYDAAHSGRPLQMSNLIREVHREYRKIGRLCLETEFGPYHELVASGNVH